jgi:hypothetical protein
MSRWIAGSVRSRWFSVFFLLAVVAAGALLVTASGPDPHDAETDGGALLTAGVGKVLEEGSSLYIAAAAHVTGSLDTDWRTDLQVYGLGTEMAEYEIALLEQDRENSSPNAASFHLHAGRSVRYNDVLWSLFGFDGSAALRITATAGSVAVSSRTYNQTTDGTYGQFIGAALESRAIAYGEEGRIIQLTHNRARDTGYRTNVGFVNCTSRSITVEVDFYTWEGILLGTKTYVLSPYMFIQKSKIFGTVTGGDVSDGYVVVRTLSTGGKFFAYASVVDNQTGDPIYIPAVVVEGGGGPLATPTATSPPGHTATPTSTPTPTTTPTPTQVAPLLNLRPFQPDEWDAPLVASGDPGTNTSGGLQGGATTYIDWAILNEGPDDAVFPEGLELAQLELDDVPRVVWTAPAGGYTVDAGFYVYLEDYAFEGVSAGSHTLTLEADPSNGLVEADEGDNSYTFSGTWSAAKAGGKALSGLKTLDASRLKKLPIPGYGPATVWGRTADEVRWKRDLARANRRRAGVTKSATTTGEPVYIAATAHVAGAAGTNWRTDVELHNPDAVSRQYEIALLEKNEANVAPSTVTYTVGPGRCLRLNDVLHTVFGYDGGAALRITPVSGNVVVTSRTYNLVGGGTYGQFIGGLAESDAIESGQEAVLIQLTHNRGASSGYRTNIGFVSCVASEITVRADMYRADGQLLGTRWYTLQGFMHRQVDKVFEAVASGDVEDGYIVVRSGTPGARFIAYASVVDNLAGDPVYIPATLIGAGEPTPPTPTATVTPTVAPGRPIDARITVEDIFEWLGTVPGQGDLEDLEEAVARFQNEGLDALLDEIADANPGIATRTADGLEMDYGSGYVLDNGDVASGLVAVEFSNVVNTSEQVAFDGEISHQELQVDERNPPVDSISGGVSLDVDPSGHAAGSASFSGTGTALKSASINSVSGAFDVDTEICRYYPIGGTVTITMGDDEHTFTFTPACDGSFDYQGPGSTGDVSFRLRWDGAQDLDIHVKEPSGEEIYFAHTESATGGQLDVDSNVACTRRDPNPTENVFWPIGQAPSGTYEFWAILWSDCGESHTPDFTFYVLEGTEIVREIRGTIADGTSPHYTHTY